MKVLLLLCSTILDVMEVGVTLICDVALLDHVNLSEFGDGFTSIHRKQSSKVGVDSLISEHDLIAFWAGSLST